MGRHGTSPSGPSVDRRLVGPAQERRGGGRQREQRNEGDGRPRHVRRSPASRRPRSRRRGSTRRGTTAAPHGRAGARAPPPGCPPVASTSPSPDAVRRQREDAKTSVVRPPRDHHGHRRRDDQQPGAQDRQRCRLRGHAPSATSDPRPPASSTIISSTPRLPASSRSSHLSWIRGQPRGEADEDQSLGEERGRDGEPTHGGGRHPCPSRWRRGSARGRLADMSSRSPGPPPRALDRPAR